MCAARAPVACLSVRAVVVTVGVVAAAVQLGRGSYVALVTPMDAANAVARRDALRRQGWAAYVAAWSSAREAKARN